VINPSKELKQIALNVRKANCHGRWSNGVCTSWSEIARRRESEIERERSMHSRPSSYSSSGGSSSSSSSSSNSNYFPGRGWYRPGLGHGYSSQY